MDFFEAFKDPNTMHALSMNQKMISALMVTVIGMGTTFIGLVVIQYMIQLSSVIVRGIETQINKPVTVNSSPAVKPESVEITPIESASANNGDEITEELVAIITAAIAASLETHTSNIVVRNILRVSQPEPAWASAGRSEQLNSRF